MNRTQLNCWHVWKVKNTLSGRACADCSLNRRLSEYLTMKMPWKFNSNNTKDSSLVNIQRWHAGVPKRTMIWWENGDILVNVQEKPESLPGQGRQLQTWLIPCRISGLKHIQSFKIQQSRCLLWSFGTMNRFTVWQTTLHFSYSAENKKNTSKTNWKKLYLLHNIFGPFNCLCFNSDK